MTSPPTLKLFSDKCYLPAQENPTPILYPFWGKPSEDPKDPFSGRYDKYIKVGHSFSQIVNLSEADIAVYPRSWGAVLADEEAQMQATQFAEQARQAGVPTVIFFLGDLNKEVPVNNSVVFRTSLSRSKRRANEFAMPAWSEDFIEKYLGGEAPIRPKRPKPVIGFCGFAEPFSIPFSWKLKRCIRGLLNFVGVKKTVPSLVNPGYFIRTRAIRLLTDSTLVEGNFQIRKQFLAGALRCGGTVDTDVMRRVRKEFVQNMVESDYILCSRGWGNYSYRFYETLSCGRIPVFVDTDCFLPYHHDIDWQKYCVWVDESEIQDIAEKVAQFHDRLSPDEFVNLQRKCRKLWEEWLSPQGFFSNFYRHFVRA